MSYQQHWWRMADRCFGPQLASVSTGCYSCRAASPSANCEYTHTQHTCATNLPMAWLLEKAWPGRRSVRWRLNLLGVEESSS